MRSITFTLRPDLPRDVQEQTLTRINAEPGVAKAGPLHPGATHPLLRRLGYAYLEDQADLDEAIQAVAAIPDVESVAAPAERHLA